MESETNKDPLWKFRAFIKTKEAIEAAKREADKLFNERIRMAEKGIKHYNWMYERLEDSLELDLGNDAYKLDPKIERMIYDPLGPLSSYNEE